MDYDNDGINDDGALDVYGGATTRNPGFFETLGSLTNRYLDYRSARGAPASVPTSVPTAPANASTGIGVGSLLVALVIGYFILRT